MGTYDILSAIRSESTMHFCCVLEWLWCHECTQRERSSSLSTDTSPANVTEKFSRKENQGSTPLTLSLKYSNTHPMQSKYNTKGLLLINFF